MMRNNSLSLVSQIRMLVGWVALCRQVLVVQAHRMEGGVQGVALLVHGQQISLGNLL